MQQSITLPCIDGSKRETCALDIAEVAALEQRIADEGTSLLTLMSRAGSALAHMAEKTGHEDGLIVVLAGSGNNGGDGWVAASELAKAGYDVALVTKSVPEELTAEPARSAAMDAILHGGFNVIVAPEKQQLTEVLKGASVVIDAILGTGFAHAQVREPYSWWIQLANAAKEEHDVTVIAADCPSGLHAQTGTAANQCITADITVTMLCPKTGLSKPEAQPYIGTLMLAPLIDGEVSL